MINTMNPPKKRAANIRTDKLRTFEGHPFQVLDDEDMNSGPMLHYHHILRQ